MPQLSLVGRACDAKPVDAEVVDAAVLNGLDDLLPNFEQWIAQIEDRHAGERQRLAGLVDQAEADRDRQAHAVQQHERRYSGFVAKGDDVKADLAMEFVQEARRDLQDADTRLKATRDALDSVPTSAPHDRLFDFALSLRDAIRGKAEDAHSTAEVNRVLVEFFQGFTVAETAWAGVEAGRWTYSHPTRRGVLIQPHLRPEVVHALSDTWPAMASAETPPPLEWAARNSDLSHE